MENPAFGKTKALAESLVAYLQKWDLTIPKIGVVLGSGLADIFSDESSGFIKLLEFKLEGFQFQNAPQFSVEGHIPKILILEDIRTKIRIMAICGRVHFNELAVHPEKIDKLVRIPRALAMAGVRKFILTNAVGGIKFTTPGTLVRILDHDGVEFLNPSPFFGDSHLDFGPKFFDCSNIYTNFHSEYITASGNLQWVPGPSYETPSQVRRYEKNNMAVVGMSVLPEAMALVQMKQHESGNFKSIEIAAISVVSNPAAGKSPEELNHNSVQKETKNAGPKLLLAIHDLVELYFLSPAIFLVR